MALTINDFVNGPYPPEWCGELSAAYDMFFRIAEESVEELKRVESRNAAWMIDFFLRRDEHGENEWVLL